MVNRSIDNRATTYSIDLTTTTNDTALSPISRSSIQRELRNQTTQSINTPSEFALQLRGLGLSKRTLTLAAEYLGHYRRLAGNTNDNQDKILNRMAEIEKRLSGCKKELIPNVSSFRETAAAVATGATDTDTAKTFLTQFKKMDQKFKNVLQKKQLSIEDAAWMTYEVGFRDSTLERKNKLPSHSVAVATFRHESELIRTIKNPRTPCYGLAQIWASPGRPPVRQLKQVIPNLEAALTISNEGKSFRQWESFTRNRFQKYMDIARTATKPFNEPADISGLEEIVRRVGRV